MCCDEGWSFLIKRTRKRTYLQGKELRGKVRSAKWVAITYKCGQCTLHSTNVCPMTGAHLLVLVENVTNTEVSNPVCGIDDSNNVPGPVNNTQPYHDLSCSERVLRTYSRDGQLWSLESSLANNGVKPCRSSPLSFPLCRRQRHPLRHVFGRLIYCGPWRSRIVAQCR